MDILNEYLSTDPDGFYTNKPCENIKWVSELQVLS